MSLPQLIDSYLAGAAALRQAVAGMSRDQALARPVPGKWSTLEVVCHLADIDALDAERMKRIIAEDRPTLMDCDEQLYAAALAYQHRDLEGEVTLIEQTRRQMARILRTLPADALDRSSVYRIQDKTEQRTLEQLLNKAIRHVAHHTPFILDKRHALGMADGGPAPDADEAGLTTLEVAAADSEESLGHVRDLFAEYAGLLRERHGEGCLDDFAKEIADMPGAYAPPDGRLLLAVDRARVVGCVALRKIGDGVCEMKRLYVRPAFRGQGIGRELARVVLAEAQRIGYARMCLDTLPSMTEALTLYRSLGFTRTGPYGPSPTAGAVYFELPLG
jgi:ribosomal protein S18 acetylase RimI-like enzyme